MYQDIYTGGNVDRQLQQHAASRISSAVTPAGDLRQIINKIEISLGKINSSNADDLLNIPILFDQATHLLNTLEQNGANIAPEYARFDTVCAEYRNKSSRIIKAIGGRSPFKVVRQSRNPEKELWWWYIDEYVDEQYRIRQKKMIRSILNTIGIFGLISLIYIVFLAPDKATRERYSYQNDAEAALTAGTPEKALEFVEKALAISPDDDQLLILHGVAAKLTNRTELAETQFTKALDVIGNEVNFLATRSQVYLTSGMPELALEDAEDALNINPESAIAYYQKGLASNALGDTQSAFHALENAASFASAEGNIQLEGMSRIQLAYLSTTFSMPQSTATPAN